MRSLRNLVADARAIAGMLWIACAPPVISAPLEALRRWLDARRR